MPEPVDSARRQGRPRRLQSPRQPPLPAWPVWWRTVALFAFVIALYNISGFYLEPWLERSLLVFCDTESATTCSPFSGGFFVGGREIDIELYWLPGIWSLIGLVIFVFPGPVGRRAAAAGAAFAATAVLWYVQVTTSIVLVSRGIGWAANLSAGPVAVVVAFLSFVAGFVILLSVMLAGNAADEAARPAGGSTDQ